MNFFRLNLRTALLDLGVFIIGIFLIRIFLKICIFDCAGVKQSPFLILGVILVFIAILHFLINLVTFLFKGKKRRR